MLGASVAVLLCTLLVAEGLTRLLTDTHPPLSERHPMIGARYTPNLEVEIRVPEAGRPVRLRFNDVGFRGPTRERAKPPGACRVAVVGDSQIAAIATDEEDTLVRRLEEGLQTARPDLRWEVLNFGVSGSSTGQELVLYRELIADFEPDLVVAAYFEGNDLIDNSDRLSWNSRIYMDLDPDGRLFQKPYSASRARSSSWLNRNSRFYVFQKELVNRTMHEVLDEPGLNVRGGGIGQTFRTDPDPDLDHAWQLTEELIRTFDEEVRSAGSDFLLLYIPAAESVDPAVWNSYYGEDAGERVASHARRKVGDIVQRNEIDAIFLTETFEERLRRGEGPFFFHGRGHVNERGQELAAREIVEALSSTGALDRLVTECLDARPRAQP